MLQLAGGGGLTATGRSALRRDGARVADGRPRRAGMGVVRRRGWGRVWGRKERRWQVAAAPSGSELGAGIGVSLDEGAATACRDWGRESELGAGIGGESREEGAATVRIRAGRLRWCGIGVWARVRTFGGRGGGEVVGGPRAGEGVVGSDAPDRTRRTGWEKPEAADRECIQYQRTLQHYYLK